MQGPANSTYALGRVLETLGELYDRGAEDSESVVALLAEEVDGQSRLLGLVRELGTLRVVLKGLAQLMESLPERLVTSFILLFLVLVIPHADCSVPLPPPLPLPG